jgi:phosphoribosylformylglycinamidine cyclo-ligase
VGAKPRRKAKAKPKPNRASKRPAVHRSKARSARKPAGKTVRPKPSRKGGKAPKRRPPRASPAPSGVMVRRPVVHEPEPDAELAASPFVVQMDKGARPVPLDAATGRPASEGQIAEVARPATARQGMTYSGSGVDIGREDEAIAAIAGAVNFQRTGFGAPMGKIGHFAGLVDYGADDALVLCTDGVGSKVEIANAMGKWHTVGIDCVAMNVNDCICVGAEPLAFVDYLAVQDPDPDLAAQIAIGLNEGCRQANCSLIGGETASLPGIVKGFDLAGTCLGRVRKANIVDGSRIAVGDVIIGLASSGIHSNGYSLARRAFESGGHKYSAPWPWPEDKAYASKALGDVLLEPTRIYVREILELLSLGADVHGLAHVTGSGLRKIRRGNASVRYDITDPLPVPRVFSRIQELGAVADAEMYKTFNMGMGFVVIVAPAASKKALALLRKRVGYEVKVVGKVAKGSGVHHPTGGVH